MIVEQNIKKLNTRYETCISSEHSHRGDLLNLHVAFCTDILLTKEPTLVEYSAPEHILTD